ncbi:MAG: hypothetical protein NVS3B26_16330 [Mycobacteriales bacterium]
MTKLLPLRLAAQVQRDRRLPIVRFEVGDVSTSAVVMPATTPALDVDRMLRAVPDLRGVVSWQGQQLRLLTRRRADDLLAGPFGFGRALLERQQLEQLLPEETLVLPAETPLALAARTMLDRAEPARHEDAVVTFDNGDVGLVPAAAVFEAIADLYQQMALRDPLTGLPNRLAIEHQAGRLLSGLTTGERLPALLYVDLDHFKAVNDSLGHRAGDQVLVEVAQRLTSAVRPGDLVARLGGDEFAVLLNDISAVEAQAIAERIILLAAAPFVVHEAPVYIGASVGIALAGDATAESTLSGLEVLLRHADAAMYRAKETGRGRVHRLAPGEPHRDPTRRAAIARRLSAALAENALTLHYQPKVNLRDGRVSEVEALARWTDAELGEVKPVEFIPVAEASGQIAALGLWVLRTACDQAQAWRQTGLDLTVGVNLSPLQLSAPDLVGQVEAVLRNSGLPASRLRLEVTESAAVQDLQATVSVLSALREMGIRISLDDFGTGYSSLAMLRDLPLNGVKIDRSFVAGLEASGGGRDGGLVKVVVEAAHSLGLTVIAEGVETAEQLQAVTALGCDAAQGFLLGRPMPAAVLDLPAPPGRR